MSFRPPVPRILKIWHSETRGNSWLSRSIVIQSDSNIGKMSVAKMFAEITIDNWNDEIKIRRKQ